MNYNDLGTINSKLKIKLNRYLFWINKCLSKITIQFFSIIINIRVEKVKIKKKKIIIPIVNYSKR